MNNICYFNTQTGLQGNISAKSRKMVSDGLIHRDAVAPIWRIDPLAGNHQTHIVRQENGSFACTCQNFVRNNNICSHINAVILSVNDKHTDPIINNRKNTSSGSQMSDGTQGGREEIEELLLFK